MSESKIIIGDFFDLSDVQSNENEKNLGEAELMIGLAIILINMIDSKNIIGRVFYIQENLSDKLNVLEFSRLLKRMSVVKDDAEDLGSLLRDYAYRMEPTFISRLQNKVCEIFKVD